MPFVDTGILYAAAVPNDVQNAVASSLLASCETKPVTTNFIVNELLTLLRSRRLSGRASIWLNKVYDRGLIDIIGVSEDDYEKAMRVYRNYSDKQWSFTDCTSFALMQRLRVVDAFAFDDHFRQFGQFVVWPS